jgi:hypothetical protein
VEVTQEVTLAAGIPEEVIPGVLMEDLMGQATEALMVVPTVLRTAVRTAAPIIRTEGVTVPHMVDLTAVTEVRTALATDTEALITEAQAITMAARTTGPHTTTIITQAANQIRFT